MVVTDEHKLYMAPHKQVEKINYLTKNEYLCDIINYHLNSIIEEYQVTGILKIVFRYREEFTASPVKYIQPSS